MDDGGAPAAVFGVVEREGMDARISAEKRVNAPPQIADAFTMNDADLEDAFGEAGGQVIRHEVFHLSGLECVQIQHAINWQFNRFVHDRNRVPLSCSQAMAVQ